MNDRDEIKELFSKKLGEHQVQVRPELWNGIQSQLGGVGSATAVGSSIVGKSLLVKGIIGAILVTGVGVGTYFMLNQEDTPKIENPIEEVTEQKMTPSSDEVNNASETIQKDAVENPLIEKTTEEANIPEVPVIPYFDCGDRPGAVESGLSSESTFTPPKVIENPDEYLNNEDNELEKSQEKDLIAEDLKKSNSTVSDNVVENKVKYGVVQQWATTNIFTPNGDGVNDYFFLETNHLKEFSISILNANNQVVYTTNDPNFRWDGRNMSGEMVPEGSYFYIVVAKGMDGEVIKQYQTLQIAR